MTPAQAREKIRTAQSMAMHVLKLADDMQQDARFGCEVPLPGAIVVEVKTERLFRVVLGPGDELTLDTLGNAGFLRGKIDWTQYDVLQNGDPDV